MKFVLIVYNAAIDSEVFEVLTSCKIETYTKWQRVLGKGEKSEPHLSSHIWPGENNVLAIALKDIKAEELLLKIRELRKIKGREGVKAFSIPLEGVT